MNRLCCILRGDWPDIRPGESMNLDLLTAFTTVILAVSMASERLVTTIKTMFPRLADEKKTPAQEVDLVADRPRRLILYALGVVTSWLSAALLANDTGVGAL